MEVMAVHDIIAHFTYTSDNCSHMSSRMEEYVLSAYDVSAFRGYFLLRCILCTSHIAGGVTSKYHTVSMLKEVLFNIGYRTLNGVCHVICIHCHCCLQIG